MELAHTLGRRGGDSERTLSKLVLTKPTFLGSLRSLGQNSALASFFRRTNSTPRPEWWVVDSFSSISAKNSSVTAYFLCWFSPEKVRWVEVSSTFSDSLGMSAAVICR